MKLNTQEEANKFGRAQAGYETDPFQQNDTLRSNVADYVVLRHTFGDGPPIWYLRH